MEKIIPDNLNNTVNINFTWKDNDLFAGKILVSKYFYNGARPKGDPNIYKVTSPIKGIKPDLGSFQTEEEAEKRCYQVASVFIKMLQ